MKPFNLEQAIAGKPIVCRDGTPAKFLYYEEGVVSCFPLGVLIEGVHIAYTAVGTYWNVTAGPKDLFMASEKKSGWINIYKSSCPETLAFTGGVYPSKEIALAHADCVGPTATIEIHWEE